jgi:hypothetical protein
MRYTVVALLALTSTAAYADRKSFGHTYEYATLPEGATEVELWHSEMRDSWQAATVQRFEEKLEIEHGITDHWDMAMYTIFQQATDSSFGLDAVHLETRYRVADRGELPVDTVLYLELAKDFGPSVYEAEMKLIMARDFDRFTAALNIIDEVSFGHDIDGAVNEIGYAFGVTYEVTPKIRVGAETWGMHGDGETRISAGPALAFAPSSKLWLVLSAGLGLSTEPEADVDQDLAAFSGRIVMGFSL